LRCHPAAASNVVAAIEVGVERDPRGAITMAWTMSGDMSRLRIPARAVAARRDGLWRHTCFELFVLESGARYFELNFSPSGEWAAYAFEGYRRGMSLLELREPPDVTARLTSSRLDAEVRVRLPESSEAAGARLALAAVVEDRAGAISYWALAHGAERPDFHAPAGFVLPLPAVPRAR
jgi:hypothetical protein